MFRFYFVIVMNLFRIPIMISRMKRYVRHPEKYSEEDRYSLALRMINIIKFTGMIRTVAEGTENLPEDGGYFLYPNHQGKYDVLGIMYTHKKPVSFIIDDKASHGILIREFTDLMRGGRLILEDLRQNIELFKEMSSRVARGEKCIIFPEGVYGKGKGNELTDFKPGSFKLAKMAKAPIVPVAIFDSYKAFNHETIGPVTTRVRYLSPIRYEEFAHMSTPDLAKLVRARIQEAMDLEAAH